MSSDPGKRRRFAYAISISDDYWIDIDCKVCGRKWRTIIHYKRNNESPIIIANKPLPDFMFYYVMLISEKAKKIFEEEGIREYELEKAVVRSMDNLTKEEEIFCKEEKYKAKDFLINPPNYYKIFIPNISAEPHEKMGLKLLGKCDFCGYEKYSFEEESNGIDMTIKEETIKPSYDIFRVRGSLLMYCTERFKNIYEKHKLTGIDFEEVELL
jgi:hypothetical protein